MLPTTLTLAFAPLFADVSTVIAQFFTGEFLELALIFFVLALVAYLFGQRGIAGMTMQIGKWLLVIFLILALISLVL